MSNDRTGERTMSSMEPCPFCGGGFKVAQEPSDNPPVSNLWYLFHEYGPIGSPARDCLISVHKYFDTEADAITAWNTRAPIPVTDEMVERGVVEIIDAQRALGADPLSWDEASQKDKADAMAVMRAALTAALGDER